MGNGWENPGPAKQVIIAGNKGELLVYNGKPALGNLILAISGQPGTDKYGNSFDAGFNTYLQDVGFQYFQFWDQVLAQVVATATTNHFSDIFQIQTSQFWSFYLNANRAQLQLSGGEVDISATSGANPGETGQITLASDKQMSLIATGVGLLLECINAVATLTGKTVHIEGLNKVTIDSLNQGIEITCNGGTLDIHNDGGAGDFIANGILTLASNIQYVFISCANVASLGMRFGNGPIGKYYSETGYFTNQSIASGGAAKNFTSFESIGATNSDYGPIFDPATGLWVCPETGLYSVTILVAFNAWVAGSTIRVNLNDNTAASNNLYSMSYQSDVGRGVFSGDIDCVKGHQYQASVFQNTGAAQTITNKAAGGSQASRWTMRRVL